MAPPRLHPRSGFTASLFGTTLAVAFLVVSTPHLLPCPAPRRARADAEATADGRRRRRRRKDAVMGDGENEAKGDGPRADAERARIAEEVETMAGPAKSRECPVPKPPGVLGRWMGVRSASAAERRDDGG